MKPVGDDQMPEEGTVSEEGTTPEEGTESAPTPAPEGEAPTEPAAE